MAIKVAPTSASFMEGERSRLDTLINEAVFRRDTIQQEIDDLKTELAAIEAYEAVKAGKQLVEARATPEPAPRKPRATNGERAPRGSKQQEIIALLTDKADGMTRGKLLEALGAKGNKSAEQSVSNALSSMKKGGKIGNKDGQYVIA